MEEAEKTIHEVKREIFMTGPSGEAQKAGGDRSRSPGHVCASSTESQKPRSRRVATGERAEGGARAGRCCVPSSGQGDAGLAMWGAAVPVGSGKPRAGREQEPSALWALWTAVEKPR